MKSSELSEFKQSEGSGHEEIKTLKKIRPEISSKEWKRTVSVLSPFWCDWLLNIITEYLLASVYEDFLHIFSIYFFLLFQNLRGYKSSSREQLPKFSSDPPSILSNCP